MRIQAHANYIRISPRKVRLILDLVRGLSVHEAETQLRFTQKRAAPIVLKLLRSAVANAEDRGADRASLVIRGITADGGPTLKRFTPRAFGRATPIRKRSSHITMVLEGKEGNVSKKEKKSEQTVKKEQETSKALPHPESARQEQRTEQEHGRGAFMPSRVTKRAEPHAAPPHEMKKQKGFLKRLFSRKTG